MLSILFRGPNSWAIGSRHSGVRLIIFKKFGQKKVGNQTSWREGQECGINSEKRIFWNNYPRLSLNKIIFKIVTQKDCTVFGPAFQSLEPSQNILSQRELGAKRIVIIFVENFDRQKNMYEDFDIKEC